MPMKKIKVPVSHKKQDNGTLAYRNWSGRGAGRMITNNFIVDVIRNACRRSMDHLRECEKLKLNASHPLRHSERMFYSTFAAAISDATPLHLSEMPVRRKARGSEPESGRTDFWSIYKKHNFFLELKQSRIGIPTKWNDKTLARKFAPVEKQVKHLKQEATGWTANGAGDCVLIGLQIILPFSNRVGNQGINEGKFSPDVGDEHAKCFIKAAAALDKNVDFCAVWTPPLGAREFEYETIKGGTRMEWNPYIAFAAKILFLK
jgi:hypothetical protein